MQDTEMVEKQEIGGSQFFRQLTRDEKRLLSERAYNIEREIERERKDNKINSAHSGGGKQIRLSAQKYLCRRPIRVVRWNLHGRVQGTS